MPTPLPLTWTASGTDSVGVNDALPADNVYRVCPAADGGYDVLFICPASGTPIGHAATVAAAQALADNDAHAAQLGRGI